MNYLKAYNILVERGKKRQSGTTGKLKGYHLHHILPKCIGGNDTPDNLTLLTRKEHYICHLLLVKIYENIVSDVELSYLIRASRFIKPKKLFNGLQDENTAVILSAMQVEFIVASGYKKYIEKGYNVTRCRFCERQTLLKAGDDSCTCRICKITDTGSQYKYNECLCGCGFSTCNKHYRWIKNHITVCACGCGNTKKVSQNVISEKLYLHGHNGNDQTHQKTSKSIKRYLDNLQPHEMQQRVQNLVNCDQIKKGSRISDTKSSVILVTHPDGSQNLVKSNELRECYNVCMSSVLYFIRSNNGIQRKTGNRFEIVKRGINGRDL